MAFPLCLVLLAALALPLAAENWPGFRGPGSQGHSAERNLPTTWSAESGLAWKTVIPGDGWSSPVIWGDRVFVTSATESGAKLHVLALDRDTGKIVWDTEVGEQVPRRKESKNSYATPTPATDGERVFVVFGDGSTAALNFSGKVLWLNRDVEFYSRHGLGASPVLYGHLVIMAFDGSNRVTKAGEYPKVDDTERLGWQIPWDKAFVRALDQGTGKEVWRTSRGLSRIAHVTPFMMQVDGHDQLISGAGNVLQGYDPATGRQLWSAPAQGEGVVPSPVTGNGLIFASSGFEKTTLRAFRPGGEIVWEQKKGCPTQPSPIFFDGKLYTCGDGGIVTCYDPATGKDLWQDRLGGNFSASPVAADGKLWFLDEAGKTIVAEVTDTGVKKLAENPLNEHAQASPAISQGRIFLRTQTTLWCVGKK